MMTFSNGARVLLALGLLLWPAGPAAAATIGFSPSTTISEQGQSFSVDVTVWELAGDVVSAYDIDVIYDAAVITLDAITWTQTLGDPTLFEALLDSSAGPGIVDLAGVSLLSDAELLARQGGGSVTLATLAFTKTGAGESPLEIVLDAVNDVKGAGARILDLDVQPGRVRETAPVPEPSAALVFASGLASVGLAQRVRRRPRAR